MQRRKSLKIIATFLLVLMLSFSINLPVFAASGIASMTTDRTVVFYVDVTGDRSLTAHVNIYSYGFTSGQMVTVQVQKPNGETCLAGFSAYTIYTDGTFYECSIRSI